jgi:uncharacterized membrane protein
MKKYQIAVTFLVIGLYLQACKHEPENNGNPTTQTTTSSTATTVTTATTSTTITTSNTASTSSTSSTSGANDSVCFNTQILPIFNSSCALSGCHDAITHTDGYNLTSYSGIKNNIVAGNPTSGKIMREINRNSMPISPGNPLTAEQKALITKWINEGALNRTCNDPCDPINATFASGVNSIITTNCVGCHNNSLASGGINLNGYTNIKVQALNGKLICSIQQTGSCSSMPKNAPKLGNNCISLIQNWITNGAQNN